MGLRLQGRGHSGDSALLCRALRPRSQAAKGASCSSPVSALCHVRVPPPTRARVCARALRQGWAPSPRGRVTTSEAQSCHDCGVGGGTRWVEGVEALSGNVLPRTGDLTSGVNGAPVGNPPLHGGRTVHVLSLFQNAGFYTWTRGIAYLHALRAPASCPHIFSTHRTFSPPPLTPALP